MTAIPFPLTSSPGAVPHDSAGRLVNAYAEPLANGARATHVRRRTPGFRTFATTAQSGPRGSLLVGSTLYSAWSGKVRRFDSAGVETAVGNLAGTKNVFWARNNKSGTPDVIVVDPDNGSFLVTSSSVTAYSASGVLPAINSVCFLDGYFFLTSGDGRCFATAINDTTVNALTVITCEGKPDSLLRAVPFTDLYLCGSGSIEVWINTTEAPPGFPFSRSKVIPRGILNANAITGFEDGFGKGIVFVGDDRCVYALNGYSPTKISTADVDRALASLTDTSTVEMFSYVVGGRSCVVLRSASFTWTFDLDTLYWHERQSYQLLYWRAKAAVNAFGKWLAGDSATGNLVEISSSVKTESGSPLIYMVESGPVSGFPNRLSVAQATFDIAQGVGVATGIDPIETDPTVSIQYSDDGGTSWSVPRIRPLGRQSEIKGVMKLVKTGMTKYEGRRWRLTVSSPVDVELTGGDMSTELRAA
jgi:hypothetical protein